MPHRRQAAEELLQSVSGVLERLLRAVAELQERERRAAVREHQDVVADKLGGDGDNRLLVDLPGVRAAHQVHDAPYAAVLYRVREPGDGVELVDELDGEADFGLNLIVRDASGHSLPLEVRRDGAGQDLLRKLMDLTDVRVVMLKLIVLGVRKPRGVACRDDRGLEALRDVHDGRKDILHVSDPEIESAGAENQLRSRGVRERHNAVVAVHRGKPRAADAVELHAGGACRPGLRLPLRGSPEAHNLAHEKRRVPVDGDVHRILPEDPDVDSGLRADGKPEQAVHRD